MRLRILSVPLCILYFTLSAGADTRPPAGHEKAEQGNAGDDRAQHASAQSEIDTLYADYRVAVENADISAYVDALHPDVRLLPPGADAIVGADNYAGFLKPVFATANYRIDVVKMPAIEVMGDVATAEYEYIIHLDLKDPDVGVSEPGALTASRTKSRYFDVLRKRDDGKWAIWRHTWSTLSE